MSHFGSFWTFLIFVDFCRFFGFLVFGARRVQTFADLLFLGFDDDSTTRHGTLTCTCPRTQTRHRKASRRRLSLCCWRRPAQALPSQRCRLRSSENLTCFENETETAARINMYKKRAWILGWGPSLDKRVNVFIPSQKRALSWQTK